MLECDGVYWSVLECVGVCLHRTPRLGARSRVEGSGFRFWGLRFGI